MATFYHLLHTGGVVAVVGMCNEFIALLWSVDFCVKKINGRSQCNWNLLFQRSTDFLNTLFNATGH
jgi:hypothetical protein